MVEVLRAFDAQELVATAATRFIDIATTITSDPEGGVHGDGIARIVLTGGGTGIGLLEQLARTATGLDWPKVHVFFGDERNVDPTDPESNEGQARAALLSTVNIPELNIHGYGLGAVDLLEAAVAYEDMLDTFAPQGFDLHLLGMGGEGHINSLFPHSAAVAEVEHRVLPIFDSPKPPAERVTLTLPAVNSAARVWLLVSGAEKAEAAAAIVSGADAVDWPASGAQGREETLLFLAENADSKLG